MGKSKVVEEDYYTSEEPEFLIKPKPAKVIPKQSAKLKVAAPVSVKVELGPAKPTDDFLPPTKRDRIVDICDQLRTEGITLRQIWAMTNYLIWRIEHESTT